MDGYELERRHVDDDDGEIIGDFDTLDEAIAAAMEDAAGEDAAFGTAAYADCGHFEIQIGVDPDDDVS